MKKFLLTIVVALAAVSANAQVYVGGGVGIGSSKADYDGAETVIAYKLKPEIGYNLNEKWAIGVEFGWSGANKGGDKAFEINPYARYNFFETGILKLFVDGSLGYGHEYGGDNIDHDIFSIGLKPGMEIKLADHLSFETHVGFLGYQHDKYEGAKVNSFGLDLDGTNIIFGLCYEF